MISGGHPHIPVLKSLLLNIEVTCPGGRGGGDYVAELQTSAGKEVDEACMFYRRSSGERERKTRCCLEGTMFMLQEQMRKGM